MPTTTTKVKHQTTNRRKQIISVLNSTINILLSTGVIQELTYPAPQTTPVMLYLLCCIRWQWNIKHIYQRNTLWITLTIDIVNVFIFASLKCKLKQFCMFMGSIFHNCLYIMLYMHVCVCDSILHIIKVYVKISTFSILETRL